MRVRSILAEAKLFDRLAAMPVRVSYPSFWHSPESTHLMSFPLHAPLPREPRGLVRVEDQYAAIVRPLPRGPG